MRALRQCWGTCCMVSVIFVDAVTLSFLLLPARHDYFLQKALSGSFLVC